MIPFVAYALPEMECYVEPITVSQIVLKVVSACNLNCTYCYVYNAKDKTYLARPGILSQQLASKVASRIKEYCADKPGHCISICLHGGEPLLLGKERFANLVKQLRDECGASLGSLNVQTNATLIDKEWAQLLKQLRISVSVSLDGPPEINDIARVDHKGRGSALQTVAGIKHLMEAGVHVSVLCVAQPRGSGADTYHYLRAMGITDMDFLLPDITHDDWQEQFGSLSKTPIADYLIPALHAWLAEDNPNVEIRFFADMFRLILGDVSATDAFGGGAMPYIIIETDGTIQANDALRVCEESLNHTGLNVIHDPLDALLYSNPVTRDLFTGAIARPDACHACDEFNTCGGGYMPHRYSRERIFNNPSVWCADILALFAIMRNTLERIQ